MLWAVMALACNREHFDSERSCDGLDDDQDGVIDEEVVGIRYDMARDLGGAPDLDPYFSFEVEAAPGVALLTHSYEYDGGHYGVDEKVFGVNGRLASHTTEFYRLDGSSSLESYVYEYEQGHTVYERYESFEDEVLVSGYETVGRLNGEGDLATQEMVDLMEIEEDELIVFDYFIQGKLLSKKRYVGSNCSAEYWNYPSDGIVKHVVNRGCDSTPSDTATYSYVYERDVFGRLVSFVNQEEDVVWTWTWAGDQLTRDAVFSSGEERREFEYEDGRFVQGSADDMGEDWMIEYDAYGNALSVELSSQDEDEQVRLEMDLRDQESGSVIDGFRILVLEGEGERDRRWWEMDLELVEAGSLVGGLYEVFGSYYAVEHTWTHFCHEAQP